MMVRLVKMTFKKEKVEDFKNLFEDRKSKIRNFKGCQHLELLQGKHNQSNVFYTYSYWNDEQSLDNYRYSDLFKETWKLTKAMFSDKPEAISLDKLHELK